MKVFLVGAAQLGTKPGFSQSPHASLGNEHPAHLLHPPLPPKKINKKKRNKSTTTHKKTKSTEQQTNSIKVRFGVARCSLGRLRFRQARFARRNSRQEGQILAVYDLGGGTFDISVLEISSGIFEAWRDGRARSNFADGAIIFSGVLGVRKRRDGNLGPSATGKAALQKGRKEKGEFQSLDLEFFVLWTCGSSALPGEGCAFRPFAASSAQGRNLRNELARPRPQTR